MKLRYRYGWPLGHVLAKAGLPIWVRVNVIRDDEAGVFVGTSPDVRGLVIEAETLEDMAKETRLAVAELITPQPCMRADVRYREGVALA